jgi:hypothetical protein
VHPSALCGSPQHLPLGAEPFLSLNYVPGPLTLVEDIMKLMAGPPSGAPEREV